MEFTFNLGLFGWAILIVGALVIGVVLQLIGEPGFRYEWIVTAIAAFLGGLVASEFIVGWRAFEPVVGELALIPALIGVVVVGLIVAVATRYLTGGSYLPRTAA